MRGFNGEVHFECNVQRQNLNFVLSVGEWSEFHSGSTLDKHFLEHQQDNVTQVLPPSISAGKKHFGWGLFEAYIDTGNHSHARVE